MLSVGHMFFDHILGALDGLEEVSSCLPWNLLSLGQVPLVGALTPTS